MFYTFLNIVRGSLKECRYYLILTRDHKYCDVSDSKLLLEEVGKLLEAYCQSVLNSEFLRLCRGMMLYMNRCCI
ncbi:MAG: four helix bundle protein [Clostridiaceae bacterium]|nr:four helix bundle protein [Clostridiaceae bacterium]